MMTDLELQADLQKLIGTPQCRLRSLILDLMTLMLLGGVDGEASVDIKRQGRNRDVTVKSGEFAKMAKEEIRVIRLKEENGDEVHVEVEIND